jgi:hypothetical protein
MRPWSAQSFAAVPGSLSAARPRVRRGLARIAAGVAGALLALSAPSLPAAELEGVQFDDAISARGIDFKLHGVGLLRYMVVIKAYVAALYLGPGCTPDNVLADAPKRLEITYFHGIGRDDFIAATRSAIEQNVTAEQFATLSEGVEAFVELYKDVVPGDRYALTYIPGVGTELALNGTPLGVVDGATLGAAIFAIWFGDAEIDGSLKEALLEG